MIVLIFTDSNNFGFVYNIDNYEQIQIIFGGIIKSLGGDPDKIRGMKKFGELTSILEYEYDIFIGMNESCKGKDGYITKIEDKDYCDVKYYVSDGYCNLCSNEYDMVMIHDDLWNSIAEHHSDVYCVPCIEKKLGRKIESKDLKYSDDMKIPVNITFAEKFGIKY